MANVFGDNHERCRQDNQNGIQIKFRCIEGGQGKPERRFHTSQIHHATDCSDDITAHNTQQNGDNSQKATAGDRREYRNRQSSQRYENCGAVTFARNTGHISGGGHELQTDNGDDGAHGGRREQYVNPMRSHSFDNQADKAEDNADSDKAAQGCLIAVLI